MEVTRTNKMTGRETDPKTTQNCVGCKEEKPLTKFREDSWSIYRTHHNLSKSCWEYRRPSWERIFKERGVPTFESN